MALEEELSLDIGSGEQAIDRLGKLLEQQAKLFSSALGEAVAVLNGVPVTVDTSDVAGEITGAVDSADTTTEVEAEAGDVTASIDGAVDAADTNVDVDGEAGDVTAAIDSAVDAADTKVELQVDSAQAEEATNNLNVSMGALLATAAAVATIDFFKTGVESLGRIEQISLQTDARIKSTGASANVTTQEIEALADGLERTTAAEAETTQEAANLLLTFKKIGNVAGENNNIFDRAVVTATDMATVFGGDATQHALALGKALEDPARGIATLRRNGISFTESQKATIEAMQETGDILGAQKVVLGEIESQVGGAGEAFGKSLPGQVALAGHAFGTFQEEASAALVPMLEMGLAALPDLLAALQPLINSFAELGAAAVPGLISSLGALLPLVQLAAELLALIPEDAIALGSTLYLVSRATIPLAAGLTKVGLAASAVNPVMIALTAAAAIATTVIGDNAKAEREREAAIDGVAQSLRTATDVQQAYTDTVSELVTGTDSLSEKLREAGVTTSDLEAVTRSGTDANAVFQQLQERGVQLNADEAVSLIKRTEELREGAKAAFEGAHANEEFGRTVGMAAAMNNMAADGTVDYVGALEDARTVTGAQTALLGAFNSALEQVTASEADVTVGAEQLEERIKENSEVFKAYSSTITNGLPAISEAWKDMNDDGRVSIQEFTKNLEEQTALIAEFPNTINTLFVLGFTELAAYLQNEGAEVTAQFAKELEAGGPDVAVAAEAALTTRVETAVESTEKFLAGPGAAGLRRAAAASGKSLRIGFDGAIEEVPLSVITGEAIQGVMDKIRARTPEIGALGAALGTDLADGVDRGLAASAARVAVGAVSLVHQALAAAREAAQTGSPSKLFAELGMDLGDGMAVGLAGSTRGIVAEAEAIVAAAANAASPVFAGVGSSAGGSSVGAISLTVNVSGAVTPEQANTIGTTIGTAVVAKLEGTLLDVDFDSRIV